MKKKRITGLDQPEGDYIIEFLDELSFLSFIEHFGWIWFRSITKCF